MKGSDGFTQVVSDHLQELAAKDPLFAETLKKPNKTVKDCVTYILNTVKSSGRNGFSDAEIFGMAVHYYDEDDIKPGASVSGQVVINRSIELSTDELEAAKKEAKEKAVIAEMDRLRNTDAKIKAKAKANKPKVVSQSLFD